MPVILASILPWISGAVILAGVWAASLYLGRRFGNLSIQKLKHAPNLHVRPARMIGRRGAALRDGEDGMSRIQVDGIEWPVCSNDNTPIHQGEILEVTSFDGTTLLAKKLAA